MEKQCYNLIEWWIKRCLPMVLVTFLTVSAVDAQSPLPLAPGSPMVISGVVKDRQTRQPLAHVSVAAEGTDIRTVTNDDGIFILKVQQQPKYLQFSHIGYKTCRQQLSVDNTAPLHVLMTTSTLELGEIIVSSNDPEVIVRAAMRCIKRNYPNQTELVRCFYRETARRGQRFISVAEAVADMYKTSYSYGPDHDAVAIQKGRRLMSMKARDTLGVKIQGGPVMPLMADVVKNPDYLLNEETLAQCNLALEVPIKIDDRLHYVVRLDPKPVTFYPLMGGRLFIDQESLTITRAELELDMRDRKKATDYMLVRKPVGLRFRPRQLTMTIAYATDDEGVAHMSYLRNEMRFSCDWKRRLFSAPFTTVSEMVVTDHLCQGKETLRPRGNNSFGIHERFYDRVEFFEDPDFWADYNIIEPTETLENAIGRLKNRVQQ